MEILIKGGRNSLSDHFFFTCCVRRAPPCPMDAAYYVFFLSFHYVINGRICFIFPWLPSPIACLPNNSIFSLYSCLYHCLTKKATFVSHESMNIPIIYCSQKQRHRYTACCCFIYMGRQEGTQSR